MLLVPLIVGQNAFGFDERLERTNLEPIADIEHAEQPAPRLRPVPELEQRERTFRRVFEQTRVTDRYAGEDIGGQGCHAAMAHSAAAFDEKVAAIRCFAADHLVDGMKQQQCIHACGIPLYLELLHRQRLPATHLIRRVDYLPATRRGRPVWMAVRPGRNPLPDTDWIFTNTVTGQTLYASVKGCDGKSWHVLLCRDADNFQKVSRLSRNRWRPTWRLRGVYFSVEYYDAIALGNQSRAADIARADGQLCPMPPPLPVGTVIPPLITLASPGLF